MKRLLLFQIVFIAALAGCAQQQHILSPGMPAETSSGGQDSNVSPGQSFDIQAAAGLKSKIQHVVIIVQENRSVDNLFNGLQGADTVKYGLNSRGQRVNLQPELLTARYDISHRHSAYDTEYNDGKMNGFNLVVTRCAHLSRCPPPDLRAYAYVPRSEVRPYFTMAEQYAFADRMFQTNQGPSFPAHQYLLSGTSTISDGSPWRASENANARPKSGDQGGCDSLPSTRVPVINLLGQQSAAVYPCFDRKSIFTLLDEAKLGWRYYQFHRGPGVWNAVDALEPIWNLPEYKRNVEQPPSQVLKDIAAGKLAAVSFVTPTARSSDHPITTRGTGPSWVASVVNALGKSPYWSTTAVFVTWDDWGGFYDHVKPVKYNSYELGFRVPLIVISPYAKRDFVSHKQHEFGSILKFVEKTFNLQSLGTTDVRSDDLSDCFDFTQGPRPFVQIAAPFDANYFLNESDSTVNPDEDM